ncbi:MAG: sensor histidine kinase, partial [Gammaproteobacteria bacterium]|jgi:signal transduction histidine kinase|nr:sensor histidine kinase [Gammaproteobacteria bacterium]
MMLPPATHAAELNISQNQLPVSLGQYLDYLEDSENLLSFEEILAGELDWRRSSESVPTLGLSTSTHWFYVTLTTENMAFANLVLSVDAPNIDTLIFYFVQNGEIDSQIVTGDSIPLSQLEIPYRIPVIPFTTGDTGESTDIFFRVNSSTSVEIPITLTTLAQLSVDQQSQVALMSALLAFLFLCFCACLCLYYFLREGQFHGYTLFFASSLIFLLAQSGMGRFWFWGETMEFNTRIGLIAGTALIASFCLLGQTTNLVSKYRDSFVLVLRFLLYAMALIGLYFLAIPFELLSSDIILPVLYLGLLVALSVLAITGMATFQGSRTATYLFGFWIMIVVAYALMLSYKIDLLEKSQASPLIGASLIAVAAVFLLMSLGEFIRSRNEEFVQAGFETRAKGDFLRNMSREFLTPVHLILANSKRLLAAKSKQLDDGTRQHVSTVIRQSDYLHNLINDLLEMAELESDSFEPEFELIEMSQFLSEVRDLISPAAKEKGLELRTEFASANLLVQSDKPRLQHALINLLTNSIKFTTHGHITLAYKAVYFKRRLGIEISIQDTGRGMSEAFQSKLFQEFSREDELSGKEPEGTGLGLVIVKRMIEKLGGEIHFESQKDSGSQFFIRLPLRAGAA